MRPCLTALPAHCCGLYLYPTLTPHASSRHHAIFRQPPRRARRGSRLPSPRREPRGHTEAPRWPPYKKHSAVRSAERHAPRAPGGRPASESPLPSSATAPHPPSGASPASASSSWWRHGDRRELWTAPGARPRALRGVVAGEPIVGTIASRRNNAAAALRAGSTCR